MAYNSIEEIVQAELDARQALSNQIMSIVLQRYQTGKGWSRCGELQQYVYNQMGFHGRSGNRFARFISKVLEENGYRRSYSAGKRVYYGLIPIK